MASIPNVLICAGLALFLYACVGLPLATRFAPRPLAVMMAPALGWAVHSAAVLALFLVVGMTRLTVVAAFAVPVGAALFAIWRDHPVAGQEPVFARALVVALIGAALLAFAVTAGVLPKYSSEGVSLAAPVFDHSKVAMIDEMARSGVPPANPFFGGSGTPARLAYYYLWHFSAAELSLLVGITGWEADAGLTWFTAFASLAMIMGLAVWFSGSGAAAPWVIVLAATASMRPPLGWLIGDANVNAVAGEPWGFGGWVFQISWAPQHMASAMSVVLAIFLLVRLVERPGFLTALIFALTMAAGFESSTWVGGIVFPLAAAAITLTLLARVEASQRWRIILLMVAAALLALLLISPFIYDQSRMTVWRGGGAPVVVMPYAVLSESVTNVIGRWANLPAFWLTFLVIELPAFYLTGLLSLLFLLKKHDLTPERRSVALVFAILSIVSLCVSSLLASKLGYANDLGWRAALPAILLLITFAAVLLSRLMQKHLSLAFAAALALVLLGVPDGATFMYGNVIVPPGPSADILATTPELWQAVRRHASAKDRIGSNPQFLEDMTPWPVNISWALMARRRSCYASSALVGPFTALPETENNRINGQLSRVFDGKGDPDDVTQMATRYHCSVIVLTSDDEAWSRDPFAGSPYYRLVEATDAWRIYRLVKLAQR
jgi:hypothetical protein